MIKRILLFTLIWLMPFTASAQFVPIQQAKDQVNSAERTELDTVLTDISSKGDIARRQVQSILSDAASKKIGASAAGRKIETLIGKLKTNLNEIINAYAKKNPPANQLRAAYNSAQDTLNSIRRQSGEVLDQVGFDKAADPKALSGKYLDYQGEIKSIADKGLLEADDRLADKGTKATVTADLEKIASDTQRKIDISTISFLSINPDVLPSAIDRVRKGVIEEFGKAMVNRFKTAKDFGSDKALDLSPEELAKVQSAKKEMNDLAERAVKTVDSIMQQISSSNIPTASNVPGQNPLLEAKQRAVKQSVQIRNTTEERIKKVASVFQADPDNSALAKEVVAKEAKKAAANLVDTLTEYNVYFKSGDPTKKQYNKAKQDALEKAEGCTDFLCTVGRVVSTVGSGVLAKTTGIQLQPKTFSTILGIKDPQGYVGSRYTGGYYGAGGYSGGSYGGGQNVPFNPRCYSSLPSQVSESPKFSWVERARAESHIGNGDEDTLRGGTNDTKSNSNSNSQPAPAPPAPAPPAPKGEDFQKALKNGSSSSGGTHVGDSNTAGGTDPLAGTTGKSKGPNDLSQGSTWKNIFRDIAPWLNQTIQSSGGQPPLNNGYFGNCYGQTNGRGGLPGYGTVYGGGMGGSTMGCIGAIQMFDTCNVGINGGYVNQANAGERLAAALALLGHSDPTNEAKYQRAVAILRSGPMTFDKIPLLREALAGTNVNSVFGSYGSSNPISGLIYSVCAQAVNGDPALISICRQMLTPVQTPGINGGLGGTGTIFDRSSAPTPVIDQDQKTLTEDLETLRFINLNTNNEADCNAYSRLVSSISTRTKSLEDRIISASSANRSILFDAVSRLKSSITIFNNKCTTIRATSGSGFSANKSSLERFTEDIKTHIDFLARYPQCKEGSIKSLGLEFSSHISDFDSVILSLDSGQQAQALILLEKLKELSNKFIQSCPKSPSDNNAIVRPNETDGLAPLVNPNTAPPLETKITFEGNNNYSGHLGAITVRLLNTSKRARADGAQTISIQAPAANISRNLTVNSGLYWITYDVEDLPDDEDYRYTLDIVAGKPCKIVVGDLNLTTCKILNSVIKPTD